MAGGDEKFFYKPKKKTFEEDIQTIRPPMDSKFPKVKQIIRQRNSVSNI